MADSLSPRTEESSASFLKYGGAALQRLLWGNRGGAR